MTTPNISQVRQHLLDTLADLRSTDKPMDVERARAVAQVAGVLVDTARVEVDYIKATGAEHSEFIEGEFKPSAAMLQSLPSPHNPFPQVPSRKAP